MNQLSFTPPAAAATLISPIHPPSQSVLPKRARESCGRLLRSLAATTAVAALGWGAVSSASAQTCNTTGTPFQGAYTQQLPTGIDMVTMDLVTHRYTFKPQINMTMCSIGYQSPAGVAASLMYKFELKDVTNAAPVVTLGTWPAATFTPSAPLGPVHVSIAPILLVAQHTYQLRRVAVGSSSASDLIGRVLTNQASQFTISTPSIKISHSRFYGGGGPIVDRYLPFIDFGVY